MIKRKLFPIANSINFDREKMDKVYDKIIELQNRAKIVNADAPNIYAVTSTASLVTGRIQDWKSNIKHYIDLQERLQNKDHKFKIIEPGLITSTIGASFTIDAWIKSQILGFQEKTRLILPLLSFHKKKIANRCMLEYFGSYIDIIDDPKEAKYYYSLIEECQASHNVYIPCGEKYIGYHTHSAAVYIQSIWDKQGREPLFKIMEEHRERGQATLTKMGVSKDSWFVVCHVREKGFKGEEKFRDADISTYFEAFDEIVKRGGWVIRMGDSKMTPLPKMPQVIDYAHSKYKSDWMDVFLCASAKFMIGTSSGLYTISNIFGVPVVQTNSLPAGGSYLSNNNLFLPRLMKKMDNNKMLNLDELMTSPYGMGVSDGMYANIFNVEVLPNTDWEIKSICIEMMDILDGSVEYSKDDERLQEIFKAKTAAKEVLVGFPNIIIPSRIGNDFLNKHKDLLIN